MSDAPERASAVRAAVRGGAFYDDPGVFSRYQRQRPESDPTTVMEGPAFWSAADDVSGLRVLDLGCGDGSTGVEMLRRDVESYEGIDGSMRMIATAKAALAGVGATVVRQDIEDWRPRRATVDLAVSRLALHYVAEITELFCRTHQALAPGGRFIFSVLHPAITSHDARPSTAHPRTNWVIDDYFDEGPRPQRWIGGEVTWHHRTIDSYVNELLAAGFTLEGLSECRPIAGTTTTDELVRRRRIPLFLLLAARKQ